MKRFLVEDLQAALEEVLYNRWSELSADDQQNLINRFLESTRPAYMDGDVTYFWDDPKSDFERFLNRQTWLAH
jgi:hypothetical protein